MVKALLQSDAAKPASAPRKAARVAASGATPPGAKAPRSAAVKKRAQSPAPRKRAAKAPDASALPKPAPNLEKAKPVAKLVRDSFTMPQSDFALIASLKSKALEFKRPTKKSELLRAGLQALAAMTLVELKGALEALTPLKAGRPKKAS